MTQLFLIACENAEKELLFLGNEICTSSGQAVDVLQEYVDAYSLPEGYEFLITAVDSEELYKLLQVNGLAHPNKDQ